MDYIIVYECSKNYSEPLCTNIILHSLLTENQTSMDNNNPHMHTESTEGTNSYGICYYL